MTLRIGCSTGAFFPASNTEASVELAAQLGMRDVELMLQALAEYQPAFFRSLAAMDTSSQVQIHAVHALQRYHPVFDSYQRRADEGWQLFERATEGAASLGARVLVWHGACNSDSAITAGSSELFEAVDRLAGMCKEHQLSLAIENVSWCALSQTRDVMAFASRIPDLATAGSVGFAFDPFQAAEAGANPFMILAAMEGRLIDVHLRDFCQHKPDARGLMPGDGELPWPALIRAVVNAGYDGPLILEGSFGSDPAAALTRLHALLDPLIESAKRSDSQCEGALPPGVIEGIRLFNEREFYECHEVIEHEWHAERGAIRLLYQGILQIGVGFHHARGGNHRGAVLLLTDGIEKVSQFLPSCRRIDTGALTAASRACLIAIEGGPDSLDKFDWNTVPTICFTEIALERTG